MFNVLIRNMKIREEFIKIKVQTKKKIGKLIQLHCDIPLYYLEVGWRTLWEVIASRTGEGVKSRGA